MRPDETAVFGIQGKIALIIGAGSGMGRESALLLAKAGCDLALVEIDAARAAEVAKEVSELGVRAHPIVANVYEPANVAPVIAETIATFGRIDILVNIVATWTWTSLLDMKESDWDRDHNNTVRYAFMTSQAVARHMVEAGHGGAMVNISSISGLRGAPGQAAYGAAKAALNSLSRTMALEWAQYGIRVNAVLPGSIITPSSTTPERPGIPMVRRGRDTEIAKAVLFMVSDLASYVTGQCLAVDGGASAKFPLDTPGSWRPDATNATNAAGS